MNNGMNGFSNQEKKIELKKCNIVDIVHLHLRGRWGG